MVHVSFLSVISVLTQNTEPIASSYEKNSFGPFLTAKIYDSVAFLPILHSISFISHVEAFKHENEHTTFEFFIVDFVNFLL